MCDTLLTMHYNLRVLACLSLFGGYLSYLLRVDVSLAGMRGKRNSSMKFTRLRTWNGSLLSEMG